MFAAPLGLLGLIGLPIILGLHLYRRRYRPRTVSAVFMWDSVAADPAAGRSREPLRKNASLLAELLGAALLALALAGPRLGAPAESLHYVAVIDGSASMTAVASDGKSSRDRAREYLAAQLGDLTPRSRVTLILTGPEPTVIAGPLAFLGEAKDKLPVPWPMVGEHSSEGALLLASELSRGGPVDFLTDGVVAGAKHGVMPLTEARLVALGRSLSNTGITSATRTRGPSPEEESGASEAGDTVRLVIRNHSGQPARVGVDLGLPQDGVGDPQATEGETRELAPGASRAVTFTLPAGTPTVEARLRFEGGADALAADDVATLAPSPRRQLRLASMLPADLARRLGLAARGGAPNNETGAAARWAEIVPDAIAVAPTAAPHLIIGENLGGDLGAEIESAGTPWTLDFPAGAGKDPSHLVGPFLLDNAHPLLRGISFDGVVWSMDEEEATSAGGAALAYAGEIPLITESNRAGSGEMALAFRLHLDPRLSNLSRSTDWPILLANAAEMRRAALPGPERTSLAAGESFLWRACPHGALDLISPSGLSSTVESMGSGDARRADLVTPRLGEVGAWSLVDPGSGRVLQEIGVSLISPAESDLRQRGSFKPNPSAGPATASLRPGESVSWLEGALLLAAALLMALDWWVLRPKRRRDRVSATDGRGGP